MMVCAALVEGAQIGQRFAQAANLIFVQAAGHFFAVAGDKGQGVARVEQVNRGADLRAADIQFLRDLGTVIHDSVPNG